jgi:hypothetical protein
MNSDLNHILAVKETPKENGNSPQGRCIFCCEKCCEKGESTAVIKNARVELDGKQQKVVHYAASISANIALRSSTKRKHLVSLCAANLPRKLHQPFKTLWPKSQSLTMSLPVCKERGIQTQVLKKRERRSKVKRTSLDWMNFLLQVKLHLPQPMSVLQLLETL